MILVDTSVWIAHIQHANEELSRLLASRHVLAHPFVIGELALGHIRSREAILKEIRDLPSAAIAAPEEVLHFIEHCRLFGQGVGYVDVHLLSSARLMGDVRVWTDDRRLFAAAEKLGLSHRPPI